VKESFLAYLSQEVSMQRSEYSENQIVGNLKEADNGRMVKVVWRKHRISDGMYYKWKSKYGGLEVSDVRRMREMEAENGKLRRMYSDVRLQNRVLKDLSSKWL